MPRRKVYPTNLRQIITYVFGPNQQSVDIATAVGVSQTTFSPMSRGGGKDAYGGMFFGDPGYGVNRFSGETAALQGYGGVAGPVKNPVSNRLGMAAGVAGGMSYGGQTNATQAFDLMSPGGIYTGLGG